MKIQKQAFTLVELIVVIVILAILWTIAVISLQWYSKTARDSTRISDLSSMKTSLELFYLDAWKYPLTTDGVDITYSWSIVWSQWIFWDDTFKNVTRLNKIPTDPVTEYKYTYSVTKTRNEYELAGILEGDIVWSINILDNAYAGDIEASAIITWNYNGAMLKTLTWSNCYMLSLPSIVTSDTTDTTVENIVSNWRLVYNGYKNLPVSFKNSKFKFDWWFNYTPDEWELIAYSDNWSCTDLFSNTSSWITERSILLQWLQWAYSWTVLANDDRFEKLLWLNSYEWENYLWTVFNDWFGSKIDRITPIGTFSIASNSISDTSTTVISDTCTSSPSWYISSDPLVATISWNTITWVSAWSITISPIWWVCLNDSPKTLIVTHVTPEFPFDNLSGTPTFIYDDNINYSNATFQWFGSKDGHQTVKIYLPNGVAGIWIPLLENMTITDFYYTVYSWVWSNYYPAINQVPSWSQARVYNAQGSFYPWTFISHANLWTWETSAFYSDKLLFNDHIYISSQWWDPYYIEFYVTTWWFDLNSNSIAFYSTTTISDTCVSSPTSYTSSDTSVATVSWTIISWVSAWTTIITPTSWNCSDMTWKTLTVLWNPPVDISYPFDNLDISRDLSNFIYDDNGSWADAVYQWTWSHNWHQTVKIYLPNGVAGIWIPLLADMTITEFTYTVYASSNANQHWLAVNQVPSGNVARVYNANGAFYSSAVIDHANMWQWKTTAFFPDKLLFTDHIFISTQWWDPYYVEFYVSTL
jgi:prepilin-type N-terminal cleavage/methylation domain-containing protein